MDPFNIANLIVLGLIATLLRAGWLIVTTLDQLMNEDTSVQRRSYEFPPDMERYAKG